MAEFKAKGTKVRPGTGCRRLGLPPVTAWPAWHP